MSSSFASIFPLQFPLVSVSVLQSGPLFCFHLGSYYLVLEFSLLGTRSSLASQTNGATDEPVLNQRLVSPRVLLLV